MARLRLPHVPSWRDVNQVTLGLVSLLVLAGFLTAAFSFGTLDLFSERYEMSAVFSDTGGLKQGDDVRVDGAPVGEVTGVHADCDAGPVLVNVEVEVGICLGPKARPEIGAPQRIARHNGGWGKSA